MDYRILGPLEVSDGDRPLALGGENQRALLAVLLLHAGEVVSVDRLIDDLWGERSPSGAQKALQAHISRLRKALDADGAGQPKTYGKPTGSSSSGVLLTRGHGYLLRVQPGELDLDRFRTIVQAGRRALVTGDPQRAADTLRAGLAFWRGLPLADFAYEPFAQAPMAELAELRLGAVEEFCDPRFDTMVRRALAAEAGGSPSARLWATADHELADQAPDVYLVNPSTTDFVSSRAGNYQYNPWIGILIDQLWVR
jgi:DNA-binding SARP family transcriptional activator